MSKDKAAFNPSNATLEYAKSSFNSPMRASYFRNFARYEIPQFEPSPVEDGHFYFLTDVRICFSSLDKI